VGADPRVGRVGLRRGGGRALALLEQDRDRRLAKDRSAGRFAFENDREANERRDHREGEGRGPLQVDPEDRAEGRAARRGRPKPSKNVRGEVRRRGRDTARSEEREGRFELGGGATALAAAIAVGLEMRALGRRQLSVVQAGEKVGQERRMGLIAFHGHVFPESTRGASSLFKCPRPREILDLTVPTGRSRDVAISS
jgi:hypothetical protein